MIFSNRKYNPDVIKIDFNGIEIKQVTNSKFLGVVVDDHLSWNEHINSLSITLSRNIGVINKVF